MKRIMPCVATVLATVLLAMVCACGGSKSVAPAAAEAATFDKEQVWQLVSLRGKDVGTREGEVLLMLHPESGTLRGHIACNRYFADYTVRMEKVTAEGTRYSMHVTDVGGGNVQCPEVGMALQERYLALLTKTTSCVLTPYTLTLMQKDKELMKFGLK